MRLIDLIFWATLITLSNGIFPKKTMDRIVSPRVKGRLYVGSPETLPIRTHGGSVMWHPLTVYLIFYGNWARPSGSNTMASINLITNYTYAFSNSPRFKVNHAYASPSQSYTNFVPTTFTLASTYIVPIGTGGQYIFGSSLTDNNIGDIVSYATANNAAHWGPPNPNGVYFVLTSSDINETSGFCTEYCGWHSYGTFHNVPAIKFAFVGNAARCLNGCSAQSISPNGNPGVDAMLSIISHELDEMVTDPNFFEWYDVSSEESADKCAWTWGSVTRLPSGAYYNMQLTTPSGTKKYLIQRQWKISISAGTVHQIGCSMS